MKKPQPKKTRRRPIRRFHTVDLNDLSADDEHENPDWLVGAN